ncbi:hypothetical protein RI065_04495 [Mycoplasmatota bacterium zrk1]
MKLYHVSDNKNIEIFEPRSANKSWPGLYKQYVWAISSKMVHNYYFPRNCPRVCWMIGPNTSEDDKNYFKSFGEFKSLIFVKKAWEKTIEDTIIYRYEFDNKNFYPVDYSAGYYVSEREEIPKLVEIVDLKEELKKSNVKLIFVEDLSKYQCESTERTFRFSNIRMKFLKNSKNEVKRRR